MIYLLLLYVTIAMEEDHSRRPHPTVAHCYPVVFVINQFDLKGQISIFSLLGQALVAKNQLAKEVNLATKR